MLGLLFLTSRCQLCDRDFVLLTRHSEALLSGALINIFKLFIIAEDNEIDFSPFQEMF